jgi:hypothetical protein
LPGPLRITLLDPPPLRNQLAVPKINQEINEPSNEMVGVKITVTNYRHNNRIFVIFSLVDLLFSSPTTLCFTLKIINCNQFHSDLISLFEKLDKNIEIGNNE